MPKDNRKIKTLTLQQKQQQKVEQREQKLDANCRRSFFDVVMFLVKIFQIF